MRNKRVRQIKASEKMKTEGTTSQLIDKARRDYISIRFRNSQNPNFELSSRQSRIRKFNPNKRFGFSNNIVPEITTVKRKTRRLLSAKFNRFNRLIGLVDGNRRTKQTFTLA